jgi:tetratricopeptide (TPR) repeat protein
MNGELVLFPSPSQSVSAEAARRYALDFLALDTSERVIHTVDFHLDEPETLLSVCQVLEEQIEMRPAVVADSAAFLYENLLRASDSRNFLFDEREYYLGELAMLAGGASRILHRHEDALRWFDRSQSWLLLTANATGDVARVQYQRLALYMEQRRMLEVLHLAKPLKESFARSGAKESSLKCEYLQGMALRELGENDEALKAFEAVLAQAIETRSKLVGPSLVMLVQIHADLGHTRVASELVRQAEPILREANNLVALGKLYWGVGLLLRAEGRSDESIQAFRIAQEELRRMELKADVAALHLLIADLLLEGGQERQAEWEIRAALPIIDELKMVPEGFAAMSLLRESLRRRSIDRQALRNLHGYFEETGS